MSIKKTEQNPQDPYANREAERYENPVASREWILETLQEHGQPLAFDKLAAVLEVEGEDQKEGLHRRIKAMLRDGQLVRNRKGAILPVDQTDLFRGRVVGQTDGSGYLLPDGGGRRIYLAPRDMRSLMHGDRVVAHIVDYDSHGEPRGQVAEVLSRGVTQVVGRFMREGGVGFVVPDNRRIAQDILIPAEQQAGASHRQLVVAEITSYPSDNRQPLGKITEVLGDHVEAGMEIMVAQRAHGIPVEWPPEVLSETDNMPDEVPEDDKRGRTDLRKTPMITIDGEDARDFDDAVYAEPTDSGWRLLVAIADVSHYVRPGMALDDEARHRGTSVYFPRAVVPMLPEKLSNGLCSLKPEVDRLSMVCDMRITANGAIQATKFYRAVIRSHARLTYTEVAAVLADEVNAPLARQKPALVSHIRHLYGLYQSLRTARERRGALDFDSLEPLFHFDETGKVTTIEPYERNDAHRLIEECMIAANVATARYLDRHKIGALYRVHEGPNEDRMATLREFLDQAGLQLPGGDSPTPKDFARLMQVVQKRPDKTMIETVMLRSLQTAVYHPENIGHFGLGLDKYAHFTSPIRRYPDLMVHRAIGHILDGGKARDYRETHEALVSLGEHCSMTERRADEASRDAQASIKCEYMSSRLGEEYEGVISGVTGFGIFVQLDHVFVDGLVHISNLDQDYFHFDPVGHQLIGERTGIEFRLTDRVKVKVARVNKDERQVDFDLLDHQPSPRLGGKKPKRSQGSQAGREDAKSDNKRGKGSRRGRKGRRR